MQILAYIRFMEQPLEHEHVGKKLKSIRSFKRVSQEELAAKVGKTRSLISYIERTGRTNKYTIKEILEALEVPEDMLHAPLEKMIAPAQQQPASLETEKDMLIVQLKNEVEYLRDTVKKQWDLLFLLTGKDHSQ